MNQNLKHCLLAVVILIVSFCVYFYFQTGDRAVANKDANPTEETVATPPTTNPNIVLIYADDVDCETVFGQFPNQDSATIQFENLKSLAKSGLRFSNFHVTTPVCGPSRACLYSGQYAHHNQCRVNNPNSIRSIGFSGGFKTFDPQKELAIWMKRAGYTTAHVGKYLHSDFNPDTANGVTWHDIIPSGWDHFRLALGSKYLDFPAYSKATNRLTKTVEGEYRTDWGVRNAVEIIEQHAESEKNQKPLFLCWTPIAAHVTTDGVPMVAPRHESMYSDAKIPGLDERLAATANEPVEELSLLLHPDTEKQEYLTEIYRNRLRAIKSVDEGIGSLQKALKKRGMLKNTIFIFTSDHGFRIVQHRHLGKRLPYDRITKVPFIVAGPGVPEDAQCDKLLANIDITPTLLGIAGVPTPTSCDGVSFSKLLYNPEDTDLVNRNEILIENWGEAVTHDVVTPATYSSMRLHDRIYTEWATGGREFYDLKTDPDQMDNLYNRLPPETRNRLAEKMHRLRKTDALPKFNGARYDHDINTDRICGSIEPVEFRGIVESDAGTKAVEVEIQDKHSGKYWSESGWLETPTRLAAILDQPDGLISHWKFQLDTRTYASTEHSDLGARDVTMTLVGTDSKGRKSRMEKAVQFSLAFADPDTTIEAFNYERSETNLLTVSGTAKDVKKVTAVRVALKNAQTKAFWDGKQWNDKFCQLKAELVPDSATQTQNARSWILKVPFSGCSSVIVVARSYNPDKNSDRTPAIESYDLQDDQK